MHKGNGVREEGFSDAVFVCRNKKYGAMVSLHGWIFRRAGKLPRIFVCGNRQRKRAEKERKRQ